MDKEGGDNKVIPARLRGVGSVYGNYRYPSTNPPHFSITGFTISSHSLPLYRPSITRSNEKISWCFVLPREIYCVSPSSAAVPDTTHTIRTSLNISLAAPLNFLVRTHVRVSTFEIRCVFNKVRQLNMHQSFDAMAPRAFRSSLYKPFHRHTALVHTAWPEPAEDLLLRAALLSPLVHTPVQVCCAPDLQLYGLLVSGIYTPGNTGSMSKRDEAAPR
jgi:hypothetical protein